MGPYSNLIPEALTSFTHLSRSTFMKAANASGGPAKLPKSSAPGSFITSGELRALTKAALSLTMISRSARGCEDAAPGSNIQFLDAGFLGRRYVGKTDKPFRRSNH